MGRAPSTRSISGEALFAATDAFAAAGLASPRLDAELLLGEATGLVREWYSSQALGRGCVMPLPARQSLSRT